MRRRSLHLLLVGALVLPLLFAAVASRWIGRHLRDPAPGDTTATLSSEHAPPASEPPAGARDRPTAETVREPTVKAPAEPLPSPPSPADAAEPLDALGAGGWDVVDLNAVRAALPRNLYWTMSAPTKDPAVREAREAERARWNVEYGKVLSNTATAEEVDAYYMHRKRLSSDYVELATHLLVNYGTKLPKRDVGLFKLAIDMHLARLEEIPRQLAEAHERRVAHDAARRAWLEEQKAFGAPGAR